MSKVEDRSIEIEYTMPKGGFSAPARLSPHYRSLCRIVKIICNIAEMLHLVHFRQT